MAGISEARRRALLGQKKAMSGGTIIDNKQWTKIRLRLIPVSEDEVPGHEYISYYGVGLGEEGKGLNCTSPRAFGIPCPVWDVLERIKKSGSKEDKDFAFGLCRRTTEYWMGAIDKDDPGEPGSPNVRIFKAKRTIYEPIINYMVDEDDGEDITDAVTGRDIRIRKEGSGKETSYITKILDREPASEDDEYVESLVEIASTFDVTDHFYSVDLERLEAIYEALTGESIPEHYYDGFKKLPAVKTAAGDDDGEDEDERPATRKSTGKGKASAAKKPAAKKGAKKPEPEPEPEEPEFDVDVRVEFEVDGETYTGVISEVSEDADGDMVLAVVDDADGETWSDIYPDICTIIEPEEEEEQEEEVEEQEEEVEEEAEPVVSKRAPAKKAAAKKPAAKKPAAKPAAGKKTTTKRGGGKASGSIKNRLGKLS